MSPIKTVSRFEARRTTLILSLQQWTRLIRFVAAETSQIHIGEPVDRHLDGTPNSLCSITYIDIQFVQLVLLSTRARQSRRTRS